MRRGPKPSFDETRFVPHDDEQAEQLFVALMNMGCRLDLCRNLVRDLRSLDTPGPRDANFNTRISRYRRRLEELGTPPWERPGPPRPSLRLSVLMGGAASTGAIGGQFNWREGRDRRRPSTPRLLAA